MQPAEEGIFLPPEIWTHILDFFPDDSLLPIRGVSHSFEQIISSLFKLRHPTFLKDERLTLCYKQSEQKALNRKVIVGLGGAISNIDSVRFEEAYNLTAEDLDYLGTRLVALKSVTFQEKSEFPPSEATYPHLKVLSSLPPLVNLSFMSPQRFNGTHLLQLSTLCLTRLASLHCYLCPDLTGDAIATFLQTTPLPALRSLHFSTHSGFSPIHLMALTALKNLSVLTLSSTPSFGKRFASLPLKELSITHLDLTLTTLSDLDLKAIASTLKLHRLFIAYSKKLTPLGVKSLSSLPRLSQLTLDGCPLLSDSIFDTLKALPSLSFLSLYRMENLTDNGLQTLSSSTVLTSLYLDRLKRITGTTLPALSSLTVLNLSQLENFTPTPIPFSTRLNSLTFWRCQTVLPETLRHYKRTLPLFTHHDQTIV
jgi:hypothetical protein